MNKFLLAWAVGATALALVFLGYAIGRTSGNGAEPVTLLSGDNPATSTEAGADASAVPVDPYVIPATLSGLPAEWRTPFEDRYEGYAILFDPQRRELIVEQCAHRGYLDERSGVPVPEGWEFCANALWGQVQELTEHSATVADNRRGVVLVSLDMDTASDPPQLELSFAGHDMVLVPGSKNDLFQDMDRSEPIRAQRMAVMNLAMAEDAARRRLAQEGIDAGPEPVPVYALPAALLEEHRAIEAQRLLEEPPHLRPPDESPSPAPAAPVMPAEAVPDPDTE